MGPVGYLFNKYLIFLHTIQILAETESFELLEFHGMP